VEVVADGNVILDLPAQPLYNVCNLYILLAFTARAGFLARKAMLH